MFWRKKREPLPIIVPGSAAQREEGQKPGPLPLFPGAASTRLQSQRPGPLPLILRGENQPLQSTHERPGPLPLILPDDAPHGSPAHSTDPGSPSSAQEGSAGNLPTNTSPCADPFAPYTPTDDQGTVPLPLILPQSYLSRQRTNAPGPLPLLQVSRLYGESSRGQVSFFRIASRVAAVLLAVGLLIGGGIHFYQSVYQPRQRAAFLLQRAEQAEEADHTEELASSLEEYLTLGANEDDIEVLARLGQSLSQRADSPEMKGVALQTLLEVLRKKANQHEVRRELISLRMKVGQYPEALGDLMVLLQAFPDDPELERLAAKCEAALGRHKAAMEWYERANKHSRPLD